VTRHRRLGLVLPAVAAFLLIFLVAAGPLGASAGLTSGLRSSLSSSSVAPASSDFSASLTFQGVDTSAHSSAGSAITASFGHVFTSVFTWKSPDQATLVTKGTLSVLFLGATIGTTSNSLQGAVPAENGSITLTSNFGQDQYLFEGVYQLQASLFDNGQAIWNNTFYVWVQAPYHLTVVNVALILISLFEIYQIAALGSVYAARKQLGIEKPPAPPTDGEI
jgi:hypothetical protein